MTKHQKQVLFLRYFLLGKGYYRAVDALQYGLTIHTGFRKDNVTPEYQHQIEIVLYITTLLSDLMYPEDTIIAALLHDTPEDYFIDHRVISDRFGERAGDAIYLLDKNGKSEGVYYQGCGTNAITSIVKPSDRSHNINTMHGVFSQPKQMQYTNDIRVWYFPMIKTGRRTFPQQTNAYENIKHVLNIQAKMYDIINPPALAAD